MATKTTMATQIETDDDYATLEATVRDRIASVTGPVFETDASPDEMWREWLEAIPVPKRAHYNCRACQHFIQKFGRLVTLTEDGTQTSLIWDADRVPEFFAKGVYALERRVERAKVTGTFLWGDRERTWGTPLTGLWTHLSGTPGAKPAGTPLKTASQLAAEKREDYGVLCRSLAEYGPDVIAQAVRVLESDALCRSEKALGVAKWAADLHARIDGLKGAKRANAIWLAVATAPVGYTHLRSTVISTLLDDIVEGLPFDAIRRRWSEKMHPLQYQRPTAAPKAGQVAEAEKVFEKLGAARSLERRYAKLSDVLAKLWVPRREGSGPIQREGGLFDHLLATKSGVKEVALPAKTVTLEKFRREVLPTAHTIDALVPSIGPFYGLVTAVHADAPPMLQWDGLDGQARNPVSIYVWHNGSPAHQWGLKAGEWASVGAVFDPPYRWQQPDRFAHMGQSVFFALKGCRESRTSGTGLALFPETLRSEFHPVRSVVEAFSTKGTIAGADDGDANGLVFGKGGNTPLTLRVRSATGVATYTVDRWD